MQEENYIFISISTPAGRSRCTRESYDKIIIEAGKLGSMTNPKIIISRLKKELEKNPLVVGLVLVGSQIRKTIYIANSYSDMEVYIIVKDGNEEKIEKQLPSLVNKLGKVIFSYKNQWAGFSTVFENLFRLELPIVKLSEINSVFSRPTTQPVKALIDKTNGRLDKALTSRPKTLNFQKLFQDKVVDFWYMAIVAIQYYKKDEVYNARKALHLIQSSLIKFFELLNDPKILLLETNKMIEQFLSPPQIKLLKEISPSYEKSQIKQALIGTINIFSDVTKEISKKHNYNYRREIEKKIKSKLLRHLAEN